MRKIENKILFPLLLLLICFAEVSCGMIWGGVTWSPSVCSPSGQLSMSQLGFAGKQTADSDVALDPSGNSYSVGTTGGSVLGGALGSQYGAHGNNDPFVTKSDPNGNLLWVRQIGLAGDFAIGQGITSDSSGDTYSVGATTASVFGGALGFQYGTLGTEDIFVSKYDTNGNLLWVRQIGLAGDTTQGQDISIDSSGNSYSTGFTAGSVLGGGLGFQYGAHGTNDAFVTKFDTNGNLIWVRQLGIAGVGTGSLGMTLDSSGNSYSAGYTLGSVLGGAQGVQYGTHGTEDGFVSKFDTNGNLLWVNQLGLAAQTTTGEDVVLDLSGNLYVTGLTTGSVLGGAQGEQYGTNGIDDLFISKFDTNGNLLWVRQLGIAGQTTKGRGITLDSFGNSYITGLTTGSVLGGAQGIQYGTHGAQDIFVSKFDTNGNLLWVSQYGLAGQTTPGTRITGNLSTNLCGYLFLTGSTTGALGGAQYGSHGTADTINMYVNSVTGAFQ